MKYQSHTTNPTKLTKIFRSDVDISVIYKGKDRKGFTIHEFKATDLKVPGNSSIWLVATAGFSENRFYLGTINQKDIPKTHDLSQIDPLKSLHFRVFVCEQDSQKILASCEGIYARSDTDEAGSIPLLPVEQYDLGERLWVLFTDDGGGPILHVHNDPSLEIANRLRSDESPYFRALIIPEALQQALEFVAISETDAAWQEKWFTFINQLGTTSPLDLDTNNLDEVRKWASATVDAWLKKCPMKQHILNFEASDA